MSAVEQFARAHVVTDSPDDQLTVPAVLRYDPEADPQAVRIGLPGSHEGSHEWTFARQLLEQGLRAPTTSGDVHIWPCGRVQTVMEFHSAQGVAVVQFDASALIRFLRRTYAAAPVPH
ncbi:SsgA family sporulation/cell division regulator [Streptomyces durmitorensis]|uniref:SsgA family sporulation/cell division regulator n=1 Tax=Streptomyces durmitorensis TaxID=319947 RepID=A0ABY4PYJ4_9ACTN|nr:SsgA family sporulation/cell division regulator [Streptomyces durmitorensis]UQT58029.1 SsgA family sporulation/cell division regulator [Streptomyces durmitorensis]